VSHFGCYRFLINNMQLLVQSMDSILELNSKTIEEKEKLLLPKIVLLEEALKDMKETIQSE